MSGNSALPVSWYAGISLLVLVPILFFMLSLDEQQFCLWLPLISLIKALSIPSMILYISKSLFAAIRGISVGNLSSLAPIATALTFILADLLIGIYCYRRSRSLCK